MTERQRQIARGLALGQSVQDIAGQLGVRPHRVRIQLSQLYEKTGVRSQAGLVGWCVARGVVTVAELQEVYGRGEWDDRSER